ncbi:hypothetical protein [Polaribacter sp. IC073]|uniref:hypothetical protein n=1 Tax=Polaribacter sp. IC073 TaxID=2508540 RepID=UPI0011BF7107|nr:hypothetical protein [Polaribacter sp. IC073]TXD48829.1 hypothetical protein ES045_06300 [Polaribacter sp. IC073]
MKYKIKFFTFIICLLSTTTFVAQLDKSNGTKEKGKIKAVVFKNSKAVEKPNSIELNGSDGFKKAFDKAQEKLKETQKEELLNNKGIITQKQISEARFLKAFKKINGQYVYPVIDQDLGSIRTNSKSVNIICRDFQYPDGDRITIMVNNVAVVTNIVLKQSYQSFVIPLEVGINKISFVALNQGTSGPNTAAFKVYNDAGTLLSSNEWNLATDAKATLVIAKDK